MLNRFITLILGAGISLDFDYPLDKELKNEIQELVRFYLYDHDQDKIRENNKKWNAIHNMKFDRDLLIEFHKDLQRFDFNTIDQFLESNHDIYGTVAKFFIALVLLSYENFENLYRPDRATTYNFLFNHLIKDNSDISDNKISIITYNYDLSLEEYLFNRINNFVKDKDEVKSIITEMIIHVHGQLGNLDHFEPNGRKYGRLNLEKLAEDKIAEGIKIVHEVNEDMLYFKTIRHTLNKSDLIYL